MRTALRITIVIALASITSGVGAAAGSTRPRSRARVDLAVAQLLSRAPRGEQTRVIVSVRDGAQDRLRNALRAHGDRIYAEHSSLRAFSIVLHDHDLSVLAEDSGVLSISADARVRSSGLLGSLAGGLLNTVGGLLGVVGQVLNPDLSPSPATPLRPKALRDTLGVDGTWTGSGVGVAIIDSGVEASTEFGSRLTASYDFTSGMWPVPMTGRDDYGHGTHVAGTIAQSGKRSSSLSAWRGVASNARIVSLKVLDANGGGLTSDVIEAIDFAVDNRTTLGIDIINLSLGHPILEPAAVDPLVQAVERASRAGIIVVAAAGNFGKNPETGLPGYAGVISPGNAPSAITVGALDTQATVKRSDDRIASYSSRGPTWYDAYVKPDIVAPGHGIVAAAARNSTLYQNYPQIRDASDADYMSLSGTSMATAVASGVIALMVEANRATGGPGAPDLTPNAVKAVLHYTATAVRDDLGVEYDPLTRGAGALNGEGAVRYARAIDTRSPEGSPWLVPSLAPVNPYTVIADEQLPWGQAVVWGSAFVWGSTVAINQTAWGTAFVWGSAVVWGSAFVWGSNDLVWDNAFVWGSAVVWGSDSLGVSNGEAVVWGSSDGLNRETVVWGNTQNGGAGATSAP